MFDQTHLPNKQKNEKAILVIRRHWFIFFISIAIFIFLVFLPIALFIFILFSSPKFLESEFSKGFFLLLLSSYYLSILLFFFSSFLNYYLDTWIITNRRIINIEQRALFSRVVSEQKLNRIQDVTSNVHGFFPTILNYGNVTVQTAATQTKVIFKEVPNPAHVRSKILSLVSQSRRFERIMSKEDKVNTRWHY